MRKIGLAFAVACGCSLAPPAFEAGAATDQTPRKACPTGQTVAASEAVVVFRHYYRDEYDNYRYYACHRKSGRKTLMDETSNGGPGDYSSSARFLFAGRFVAVRYLGCDEKYGNGCSLRVTSFDARSGVRLARIYANTETFGGFWAAPRTVITSRGVPAMSASYTIQTPTNPGWLSCPCTETRGSTILVPNPAGETVRLDDGPGLDADSLAAGGPNLFWINDGQAKTAIP
jgi:hypothetical protein